jgi:hypothetical protein
MRPAQKSEEKRIVASKRPNTWPVFALLKIGALSQ